MLVHVDLNYHAKQAKCDCRKKLYFEMRTITKSNPGRDFFSFMSKRRKYGDALPVLAQNKSVLHMAWSYSPYSCFGRKNRTDDVL